MWIILVAISLSIVAGFFVSKIQFDMSFRPLFADEDEMFIPTQNFEDIFGEASGAHIGVILESENILTVPYLQKLEQLSDQVVGLDHVTSVISLTHFDFPIWTPKGKEIRPLIPKSLLDKDPLDPYFVEHILSNPKVKQVILSEDGGKTLLLARLDIPLKDLKGRKIVIQNFKKTITDGIPLGTTTRFTGVSMVENAYADIVLKSLIRSTLLTSIGLVIALFLFFGRYSSIGVALAGVTIGSPITLAIMQIIGQNITIVNSMVPIMLLIIGVADAIHMEQSFIHYLKGKRSVPEAVHKMFGTMGLPCLMTTVTTAIGFLSLRMANIEAIRDFGLNVAIGVIIVYIMNIIFVPFLLIHLPSKQINFTKWFSDGLNHFLYFSSQLVISHPKKITCVFVTLIIYSIWVLPKLSMDQKFNEEVQLEHPIRFNQMLLEQEFTGFLGPEVSVKIINDNHLWDTDVMDNLSSFESALRNHPDILQVRSYLSYVPDGIPDSLVKIFLKDLRDDPILKYQIQEVITLDGKWASVIVRTKDMGTKKAKIFKDWIKEISTRELGPNFEVEMVGQWWLAQRGMMNILNDMLSSFVTACILILPIMALLLRNMRLFFISLLPNIFPMLAALAFMAIAGISVRIGTAMILAIALGIAIDDTIHFMIHLREQDSKSNDRNEIVKLTIAQTGKAILYTSVILVIGFISMLSNDLIAIQDMGIVASFTIIIALLADLFFVPAIYLIGKK